MTQEKIDYWPYLHQSGLSQKIYDKALVSGSRETLLDPEGRLVEWLLDMRLPLLDGKMSREIGKLIADRLRMSGIRQVAGSGIGASAMVCATINASGSPPLRGGLVRLQPKPYGRRRLIEGPLDPAAPVVILDDLLNSGGTAKRVLKELRREGFMVEGYLTIFEFAWGDGRMALEKEGLWVDALMELTLGQENAGSSDSATHA